MSRILFVLPAALLIALIGLDQDAAADKAENKDTKPFEGRWQAEKGPGKGQNIILVFDGDKFTSIDGIMAGEELGRGTFKVDTSKSPKTIDLKVLTGSDSGKTYQGIYELKENELKVMFGEPDGKRPTSFDQKTDPENTFLLLKRMAKAK